MSTKQEDRGVDPEGEEIILAGDGLHIVRPDHAEDGTGRPAAIEDDIAGD